MANPFAEELERRQASGEQPAAPAVPSNPFAAELERRGPASAPVSEFEQQMRGSPAAGINPYAGEVSSRSPQPMRASTRYPQTLTEKDYPSLREMAEVSAQQDPFVMARRRGIEPGGAPVDLRAAYMKLPPGTKNELAKYMVNKFYEQRGLNQNVPVSFDESLDTHIFKDPKDGKWKPLNDLGMDWQDAKDFMKYAVAPAAAGAGGAVLGSAVGSPFLGATAALAADVVTSGGFRSEDVEDLIKEGLVPPDALSPGLEGAKEAAWAVGGSAVGGAMGLVGRRAISGVDDVPLTVDVDRKMVDRLLKRYDEKYGDTMPDLPLDKKMSLAAETSRERAAAIRVQSRREQLESAEGTKKELLERAEKNKADLQAGLAQFTQLVGRESDPNVYRASGISLDGLLNSQLNIINNLERPAKAELARYDAAVSQAYLDARKLADDILEGASDPERLPASFKGVFDAANENFKDNMAKQYDDIAEATGGQKTFDIQPVRDELKELKREIESDSAFLNLILNERTKGVAPRQDISIGSPSQDITENEIADIIFGQAFRKDPSGLLLSDAAKREMASDTMFGYEPVNKALLAVRKRIRNLPPSAGEDTRARLGRIAAVLQETRVEGLKKIDPQLGARQQALDVTYRLGKEALDRGIGRKLADTFLEPRPGMDGLLKPTTFRTLFQGDSGAETVRDIRTLMDMDVVMAGPNNPIDMLGIVDNVRRGLLGELKTRMDDFGRKGGEQAPIITPKKFESFKRQYRDALEFVFPPEQLDKMKNFASMKRAMEKAEADVKAVKERVMQFPWGNKEIANDPAQLMTKTWPRNEADNTTAARASRQLRDALRDQGDPPGLLGDYRRLIAQDMMAKSGNGAGGIDPHRLDDYLTNHDSLLKEWYTSPGQSGTEMVQGMKSYAEIGKAIMEKTTLSHSEKDKLLEMLNGASRAYVGIFTPAGRGLTLVKQMLNMQTTSKEADFILNPGKYVKNQEYWEILDSPQFRALMRTGGHSVINGFRQNLEAEEAQAYP